MSTCTCIASLTLNPPAPGIKSDLASHLQVGPHLGRNGRTHRLRGIVHDSVHRREHWDFGTSVMAVGRLQSRISSRRRCSDPGLGLLSRQWTARRIRRGDLSRGVINIRWRGVAAIGHGTRWSTDNGGWIVRACQMSGHPLGSPNAVHSHGGRGTVTVMTQRNGPNGPGRSVHERKRLGCPPAAVPA